jgi:CelD/BcsL family acetyltransferase involved in cellulose biosynthesis
MRIELDDDPTAFNTADWTPAVMEDPNGTFFHTPAYLKLWWEEFGAGRLVIATATEQGSAAAACVFQVDDGLLTFLGGFDVTDYMCPVARPGLTEPFAKELLTAVASEVEWNRADLRGLPDRAPWADLLESAAAAQGLRVERGGDGVCPVLTLPATYDEYLAALPSKLRHEIRRKERRLHADFADVTVEFATEDTLPAMYDRFIELHRLSEGPKGKFMHAGMEIFFRRLGEEFLPPHVFHLGFVRLDDDEAAGVIGFGFKDTFSLYNSAFERRYSKWSPGMFLIADTIRRAIEDGRTVYDLLKGDPEYKSRFGSAPMPVHRLVVER